MKPDPRFPDHPDFNRLSEVLIGNDKHGSDADEFINAVVNVESVMYAAEQRALMLTEFAGLPFSPRLISAFQTAWIDAFVAGAKFQQAGGHVDE